MLLEAGLCLALDGDKLKAVSTRGFVWGGGGGEGAVLSALSIW